MRPWAEALLDPPAIARHGLQGLLPLDGQAHLADQALAQDIARLLRLAVHIAEDGNGRVARVLANFVLAEAAYPPLIVRAGADRGEYYDALAASDEGNILPLYQLFATVIRRTVRAMARPGYTHDFLENRLLAMKRWIGPGGRRMAMNLNAGPAGADRT